MSVSSLSCSLPSVIQCGCCNTILQCKRCPWCAFLPPLQQCCPNPLLSLAVGYLSGLHACHCCTRRCYRLFAFLQFNL
ncbi:hypothetical protein L873DRAFT_1314720 [Choiromyces venosus 120613-1]|uniref:Uncharacterized protein n=1 Tax=Choiromyces venosus 120613-1 TaxID=1336337 RepID=A0A3N4JBA3_9PEZI|nr:hypothetical protein L873DRAFT_1314720 [Choiromyces venosus 120613-1]